MKRALDLGGGAPGASTPSFSSAGAGAGSGGNAPAPAPAPEPAPARFQRPAQVAVPWGEVSFLEDVLPRLLDCRRAQDLAGLANACHWARVAPRLPPESGGRPDWEHDLLSRASAEAAARAPAELARLEAGIARRREERRRRHQLYHAPAQGAAAAPRLPPGTQRPAEALRARAAQAAEDRAARAEAVGWVRTRQIAAAMLQRNAASAAAAKDADADELGLGLAVLAARKAARPPLHATLTPDELRRAPPALLDEYRSRGAVPASLRAEVETRLAAERAAAAAARPAERARAERHAAKVETFFEHNAAPLVCDACSAEDASAFCAAGCVRMVCASAGCGGRARGRVCRGCAQWRCETCVAAACDHAGCRRAACFGEACLARAHILECATCGASRCPAHLPDGWETCGLCARANCGCREDDFFGDHCQDGTSPRCLGLVCAECLAGLQDKGRGFSEGEGCCPACRDDSHGGTVLCAGCEAPQCRDHVESPSCGNCEYRCEECELSRPARDANGAGAPPCSARCAGRFGGAVACRGCGAHEGRAFLLPRLWAECGFCGEARCSDCEYVPGCAFPRDAACRGCDRAACAACAARAFPDGFGAGQDCSGCVRQRGVPAAQQVRSAAEEELRRARAALCDARVAAKAARAADAAKGAAEGAAGAAGGAAGAAEGPAGAAEAGASGEPAAVAAAQAAVDAASARLIAAQEQLGPVA